MSEIETDREREYGNTKLSLSSKKQVLQLKKWFFTWNNYPVDGIEILETKFNEICEKYVFQEECGEKGTPHLQGNIWLKKSMRWTEFKLPTGIHWEKTRNEEAANNYCRKDETKSGKTISKGFPKPLKLINPDKWWQKEILEIIKEEPDDRKVYWYWSNAGGIGKSQFVKYLIAKHNCVFIDEGKKQDIMYTIMEADMNKDNVVVLFDVPRDNGANVSYKSIESIKNGMIYSPKYESGYKLFNSPHVVVFANEKPEEWRLSSDRWIIKNIDEIVCI